MKQFTQQQVDKIIQQRLAKRKYDCKRMRQQIVRLKRELAAAHLKIGQLESYIDEIESPQPLGTR